MVAEGRHLPGLSTLVSGQQRRRRRRSPRDHGTLAVSADLGVDAIWLSPIFPSPMEDFGYDIADYCAIDPLFGTMANFDELLGQARRLGLRLLMDLVPNHTSSRHPWFIESRSSRSSEKRDW